MFSLIVCYDANYGIGKNNTIPWTIPSDLQRFKKLTLNNIVIMGKNTWNSLPKKPLLNRINIIISNTITETKEINIINEMKDTYIVKSFEEALSKCPSDKQIFIIGGSKIY